MSRMKIEINDEDFLKKTQKEQNLIMFRKLCSIDKNGCTWAQNRERRETRKNSTISALTGMGTAIGILAAKLIFWK
jgi:hypothetical protein